VINVTCVTSVRIMSALVNSERWQELLEKMKSTELSFYLCMNLLESVKGATNFKSKNLTNAQSAPGYTVINVTSNNFKTAQSATNRIAVKSLCTRLFAFLASKPNNLMKVNLFKYLKRVILSELKCKKSLR
jgi:beta-galactosidase GanA